jgi:hypothetical protein
MKKASLGFLLFSLMVVSLLVVKLEPSNAEVTHPLVFDHFNGNAVDLSKWTIEQGQTNFTGLVTVANSTIQLTSDSGGFPRVVSSVDPFPTSGDFALEFDLTYTQITSAGTGIWVSQGSFVPYESNVNANIMQVWASTLDGLTINFLTHDVYQNALYTHSTPFGYWNTSLLTIRLQNVKGVYTLFLNGAVVTSGESNLRPDVFGMGMPPLQNSNEHYGQPWTSFKIDQIRILPSPQIALSAKPSSIGGLNVDLDGTLTDSEGALNGANLLFSYKIAGFENWQQLTSAITTADGKYTAEWLPSATGNFTVKVEWQGDADHAGTFECANVSITRGSGDAVFLAESNSTLSSLAFNSDSKEVRFTASGPTGTSGYVRFVISKAILQNLTDFQVYLDQQQVQFTATSEGDSQVLFFQYNHSSHDVLIKMLNLQNTPAPVPTPFPEFPASITIAIAAALFAFTLSVVLTKRKAFRSKEEAGRS